MLFALVSLLLAVSVTAKPPCGHFVAGLLQGRMV
jgi:hypothetical protein